MIIRRIKTSESDKFSRKLNQLVLEIINLPIEAKKHYESIWTKQFIQNNIQKYFFLVALEDEEIVGLILGTPSEGGVATIIWVLVDSMCQQKKVGTKLMQEAYRYYLAEGAHKIKLTVPDEKTVAFYKKQGMQIEGVYKNHWWNVDFWAMGKTLN